MGQLGSLLVGTLMIYLPINTLLYMSENDAIGVVKSASLAVLVKTDTKSEDAEGAVFPNSYGGEQSAADQAAQDIRLLKSYGDNVHAPLYQLLQANTANISNVTVRNVPLPADNPGCGFSNAAHQRFVDLSWIDKSTEGTAQVDLIFGAVGKSFLKPLSGHVTCIVEEYVTLLDANNQPKSSPALGSSGMMLIGPIGRSTRPH